MMENIKIGFIGGGALCESLIKGLAGNLLPGENIFVADHKEKRCEELRAKYGVRATTDAATFRGAANVLIFAVKPKDATSALRENAAGVAADTVIVSVMAGVMLAKIEEVFPDNPCVRAMPNTPAAVGEGMTAYALGKNSQEKHGKLTEELFNAVGKTVCVAENLMDAVTGLSGSGPAFVFLMIDALAEGGVAAGLSRQNAILMAAQTVLGAAKLLLDTGEHPAVLKDKVTSPAGTTGAGVLALEKRGFRSAAAEAVLAARDRSRELGLPKKT